MFTDIAGYTKTMSESEQKALEMLRKKRSIIKPLIDNHKGTYVKEIGDGTLSYFESGYNASACAKDLQKEIGLKYLELETITYLYITYKHFGQEYDEQKIHNLINESENIEFEFNLRLYELLEDKSYLESGYKQIQERASKMNDELKAKYLSYPIPKAIVETWEKVK